MLVRVSTWYAAVVLVVAAEMSVGSAMVGERKLYLAEAGAEVLAGYRTKGLAEVAKGAAEAVESGGKTGGMVEHYNAAANGS